jgi:serine/threonine protein kinase
MIFELLGINLDVLFHLCNKKFTNNTTIALGLQIIERLEFIHSRHIIHRDIKPDNFLIGKGKNDSIIYICDFGLSKRFRDKKTGLHIPYKNGNHFIGTPIFASIYTHLGIEQSRRDDLESLAYILIYFRKGDLPWTKVKGKNRKEKYSKVLSLKININISDLCSDLPEEYSKFLKYVRDLQFEEKPDYDYLKNLLKTMFVNEIENNVNLAKIDYIDMLIKKIIYKNDSEFSQRHIIGDIVNNYMSKKSIELNSKE